MDTNSCIEERIESSKSFELEDFIADAIKNEIKIFDLIPDDSFLQFELDTKQTTYKIRNKFVSFFPDSFFNKQNANIFAANSQDWIGYVTDIQKDVFSARLFDIYDNTTYETAEFEISDVSKDDIELLKIGAIFYWSVGPAIIMGQVKKQSFIKFKRIQNVSADRFDEITDSADKLFNEIKWE